MSTLSVRMRCHAAINEEWSGSPSAPTITAICGAGCSMKRSPPSVPKASTGSPCVKSAPGLASRGPRCIGTSPTSERCYQPSPPKGSARCVSNSSRRGRTVGSGLAAFETMGVAYLQFAVANPAYYRVMFGGFVDPKACDPELAVEAAGAFQALVDALAALQRDGLVRDDDTVTMARFVWAVVHGVAMLGIDGQLREPGVVELMRYSLERLRTGIEA